MHSNARCEPWRGRREWYQYEARLVLHPNERHLWFTHTCETEMCLSPGHLVALRPAALDYLPGVCVYCGLSSDTRDHLIPRGWSGEAARSYVLTVPACRECNGYINDLWAPTITERRAVAQKAIKRRNRTVLKVRRITQAELDDFGRNLRSAVDSQMARAEVVKMRLEWPPGGDGYDYGACVRAGFDDPYEAGLLLASAR